MAGNQGSQHVSPSTLPPFQETAGPTFTMPSDAAPIDFFQLFITDDILDRIVRGSNEYADAKIERLRAEGKLKDESRWKKWKSVTRDDMKRLLCDAQYGDHPAPRSRVLLDDGRAFSPFFHDVMPKNRFLDIFWMLDLPSESWPLPRRVDKIQPLLSHRELAFQSHFFPAQNVCVDETMVGFKSRVKFKQ